MSAFGKALGQGLVQLGQGMNENYQRRKQFEQQTKEAQKNRDHQIAMQEAAWKREERLSEEQRDREALTREAYSDILSAKEPDKELAEGAKDLLALSNKQRRSLYEATQQVDKEGATGSSIVGDMVADLVGEEGTKMAEDFSQQAEDYYGVRKVVAGREVFDTSSVEAKMAQRLQGKGDTKTQQELIKNLQKETEAQMNVIIDEVKMQQKEDHFRRNLAHEKTLQEMRAESTFLNTVAAGVFRVDAARQSGMTKAAGDLAGHQISIWDNERKRLEDKTDIGGGLLSNEFKVPVYEEFAQNLNSYEQDQHWDSFLKSGRISEDSKALIEKFKTFAGERDKKGYVTVEYTDGKEKKTKKVKPGFKNKSEATRFGAILLDFVKYAQEQSALQGAGGGGGFVSTFSGPGDTESYLMGKDMVRGGMYRYNASLGANRPPARTPAPQKPQATTKTPPPEPKSEAGKILGKLFEEGKLSDDQVRQIFDEKNSKKFDPQYLGYLKTQLNSRHEEIKKKAKK